MEHAVERELLVPETADEVWDALAEPEWLGSDASIDLVPAGEVRAGERTGFVEKAEPPSRLVFWWRGPEDDEATRVELDLEEVDEGTRVGWSSRARWRCSTCVGATWSRCLAVEAADRWRWPAPGQPWLCADGDGGPRRRGVLRPLRRHAAKPVRAARESRGGQRHRPRARAAGVAPGGAETPGRAGRRRPRGGRAARDVRSSTAPRPRRCPRRSPGWPRWGRQWDDRLAALERQLSRGRTART